MPLLEVKNLRKAFGSLVVLDGVDLTVEKGMVTTIIGRSGIGKSVLLKHIIGLLAPDDGEVYYEGRPLFPLRRKIRRLVRQKCSYMFQQMALFDSMTVFENIALPLLENGHKHDREVRQLVLGMTERLDLSDVADKFPSQLSGGMCKRVALARALVTDPEVVLFDEPTTGLDPIRKRAVHEMIDHYKQEFGFTAVIVSHDIPDVFDISQKIAMLEGGKIIFEGDKAAIYACEHPAVKAFLHDPKKDEPSERPVSQPTEEQSNEATLS